MYAARFFQIIHEAAEIQLELIDFCFSLFPCNWCSDKSPNWIPDPIRSGLICPFSIKVKIERAHFKKVSSTFSPFNALHSIKIRSLSLANWLASEKETSRWASKSFLFPTKIMMIDGLARFRASVSQFCRELNESRLAMSYTKRAPAAPL